MNSPAFVEPGSPKTPTSTPESPRNREQIQSLLDSAVRNLTPRGLASSLIDNGEVELFVDAASTNSSSPKIGASRTSEKASDAPNLTYSLYLWNGKEASDVVKVKQILAVNGSRSICGEQAVATAKGFELHHRLKRKLNRDGDRCLSDTMERLISHMDTNCTLEVRILQ